MGSTTKAKRIARIERRGSPELVDALRRGLISARTADNLFYLPTEEQRTQLERRLAAAREREGRSQLAAQTIRSYLDSAQRIDLAELQCRIRKALATTVVLACLPAVFFIS
jgi:hypothetical protein